MKLFNTLVVAALLLTSVTAFAPLISPRRYGARPQARSSFPRFYQNEDSTSAEIPQRVPILPRVEDKVELAFSQPAPDLQPPTLVLPSTAVSKEPKQSIGTFDWTKLRKRLRKWRNRPGVRFRLWLGAATAVAFTATSLVVPRGSTRLLSITKSWVSHRGFQGVSALGRTVAYVWALLVAYPRMLDRRSTERKRQRKDEEVQRRRTRLDQLATEVARLRQELTGLDAEIRAFRREIISLKAYAREDGEEIQAAINQEMAHLTQLRSDAQAALSAARRSWADYRSMSPPEIWDDALVP